jgi:hypothetical protein
MKELQSLNPEPDRASNDMVLFMVMNASSVTLVPISIMTFRAQLGAANPADVFVPILIATYVADLSGLLLVAAIQKLNLWNGVVLAWLGTLTAVVAGLVWYFSRLPHDAVAQQSAVLANSILIALIASFLLAGASRRCPCTRLHRGRQGRFRRRDRHRALSGGDPGGGRVLARERRARGVPRRRQGRREPPEHGHPLGGRHAHRPHQAAFGRRRARHDGGHHEGAWDPTRSPAGSRA